MAKGQRKAAGGGRPGLAGRGGRDCSKAGGATGGPGGLSEAARLCRAIATDLKAEGFGLLFSVPTAEHSVTAVFDGDHPLRSPYLGAFLDLHDGELARHAAATSAPLWWGALGSAAAAEFADLPWAARLDSHGGPLPGIAFPCYAERGPHGLILFWGRRLTLGGAGNLFSVHARCFALFEAVALIQEAGGTKRPQLSKRQLECLALTADGRTSDEIAKLLGLSIHTTNQHLAEAAQELNTVNRIHAVAKALRLGLLK